MPGAGNRAGRRGDQRRGAIGPPSRSSATMLALTNGFGRWTVPPAGGRMPSSTSTVDIEAIERGSPARGDNAGGLLDPLLEARLAVPRRHVGTLRRTRLLRQLRSARDRPVISMVAPPGYGKSSLLVQWATEDSAPVAWLTADDTDSDPVVFLTDLAAAIDRRVPLGAELFERDRGGHGVAPDRGRAIAGSDVPTPGAGPDRHRRRASDHLTGVPRHPCGAGRAPARRVAGGRSRDAPGCASRSPAGAPRVHCSRSVRRSWRWTSVRPSASDANSGCGCRPKLRRA